MHTALARLRGSDVRRSGSRLLIRLLAVLALLAAALVGTAPQAWAATPVAYDGYESVPAGEPMVIVLAGEDEDLDTLSFAIATPPTSGTLGPIGAPQCDFGYCEANVTYTGTGAPGSADFFTFTVSDGTTTSAPATVDIDIETSQGVSIVSSGPLTKIRTTPDLNCAVNHVADNVGEWYGDTACGTFVAVGGSLFGPAQVPAGSGVTGATGYVPFTPVSQAGPTGAGTQGSPYVITTVVALGTSGVRLTQTDSYVQGQESYRTDVALSSTDSAAHATIVYRAGDCYLQDSDDGLGQIFSGRSPSCQAEPTSTDPNRIEGFFPLTDGSHYMEAGFSQVWTAVGTQTQLPDTCRCAEVIDNGVALSWPAAVAAAGTTTISSLTVFSPLGATPVSLSKTADASASPAGSANGYTVTVSNPGAAARTLTSITDTLPAGFSYVAGSTTGLTSSNPTISGQNLTWSGSFIVPAATGGTAGTLTLHFGVTVAQTPGTYTNSVTAVGSGVTVIGASGVAPVTVTAPPVDETPPDTTITAGPSGLTSDTTPTFSFTSEAGATFECRVDGGAWGSCTSPYTTGVLGQGAHTFEVRATDAAGNVDASPASRSFTVDTSDTTPPDTTITAGPTGTTGDSTPSFSFSSEAGATFECRVDGGAWVTCTSAFTTAVLGEGPHTFEVRAIDGSGNVDASPASRAFTVDTTPPDTTITAGPAASSEDTTPTFAFTGTGGATGFQCRLDGGAWAACTSPHTVTVGLGAHTFEVRAGDAVGNLDPTPASLTFTVTAPPPPPPPPAPSYTCGGKRATIVGTAGADALSGTGGNDVIVGLGGNDKIDGGGGNDLICAGDGNDVVQGAAGKDVIDGGAGKDKLLGGGGADEIDGGDDDDRLQGNGGKDELDGGAGDDVLKGAAGDDTLDGSAGDDRLEGDGGNDNLKGGPGKDYLDGGAGKDHGDGGGGSDTIIRCES